MKRKFSRKNWKIKEELITAKYKISVKIPHYQVKNTINKVVEGQIKRAPLEFSSIMGTLV